jgi:hypothetical protein
VTPKIPCDNNPDDVLSTGKPTPIAEYTDPPLASAEFPVCARIVVAERITKVIEEKNLKNRIILPPQDNKLVLLAPLFHLR